MWILDSGFWILNYKKFPSEHIPQTYFKIILVYINIFCIFAS